MRTEDVTDINIVYDWIYWTRITPGDRDQTSFHKQWKMTAAINKPDAITHYPTAGTNVLVVASNTIGTSTGLFSVSLFYLDLDEDASDTYFVEHFTVFSNYLSGMQENY